MMHRWIASGIVQPEKLVVIDPGQPSVPDGVTHLSAPSADDLPDIVVLAIKPQQLDMVAPTLAPRIKDARILVSILAGVEEAALASRFDVTAIVRAMPNLPVSIGKGVVALFSGGADACDRVDAAALMSPLGLVEWIERESLFDAVTALSGCGPGFVYRFIDAMAAAGEALGLSAEQALRLATATVEGSAILAADATDTPAVLADRVASPGGSTREGLNVLDDDDAMRVLMRATLAASARRNAEMAAAAR